MIDAPLGRTLNEAEVIALVRVGALQKYLLDTVALEKLRLGEPGDGDIHPDTAELIEGYRQGLAHLQSEDKRIKALLLSGGNDDATTEAAEDLWLMNEDPGRAELLAWAWYYRHRIGRRPFSRLLADSWNRPKVGSLVTSWGAWGQRRVLAMFEHAIPEYLMDREDLEVFHSLPHEIRVWRGCSGIRPGRVRYGMSWSRDREKAIWFANRSRFSDLDYPIVLEATVRRPNVLAYFNGREEQEIVVKPGRVMA